MSKQPDQPAEELPGQTSIEDIGITIETPNQKGPPAVDPNNMQAKIDQAYDSFLETMDQKIEKLKADIAKDEGMVEIFSSVIGHIKRDNGPEREKAPLEFAVNYAKMSTRQAKERLAYITQEKERLQSLR